MRGKLTLRILERKGGNAVLKAVRATNLLRFEERTLAPVLQGPSADAFVRAAARFALHAGDRELAELESVLRPYDCARWTVVTYLPFLWRPDAHMFLKPEITKDFASRVGHSFAHDYEPKLAMRVYDSLLDLTAQTESELKELHPRDRIDVQSFIWVIGEYSIKAGASASPL